jgi:hypothetical protein
MSVIFYPEVDRQPLVEIGVDDPGHGYLWVRDLREDWPDRVVDLSGPYLGEVLTSLTELALGEQRIGLCDVARLGCFALTEVRAILPSFQRAVIYASTRSEFAERILDRPDRDDRPREIVCVDCGEGHVYSSDEGRTSAYCANHGHRPFGSDATWARAQERYEDDVKWFEIMHRTVAS